MATKSSASKARRPQGSDASGGSRSARHAAEGPGSRPARTPSAGASTDPGPPNSHPSGAKSRASIPGIPKRKAWHRRLQEPVGVDRLLVEPNGDSGGADLRGLPRFGANESWVRSLRRKNVAWLPFGDLTTRDLLHQKGVRTIAQLMAAEPRDLLQAGVPAWRLRAQRAVARLVALPGLDRRSAELLYRAGITSIQALREAEAAQLVARLNELEKDRSADAPAFRYQEERIRRWQTLAAEAMGNGY